jgi:uncharacterized protein (TIGR03437 family)
VSVLKQLRDSGKRTICYFSAGTYEPWRPDASRFPARVRGAAVEGFSDERWLDIRQLDVLGPILEARLDLCREKGFDAAEPDNVDGYANRSGFPLTAADQLRFNRFLATAAHRRGLSVGLKNDLDQVRDLAGDFDWALNEECFQYKECEVLLPFTNAGKPVFHVEYELQPAAFCNRANELGFNSLKKNINLDAARTACREAAPELKAALHGASYAAAPLAPGAIVSLFGNQLGPAYEMLGRIEAGRLASQLETVRVFVDGEAAPLLYAGSTQLVVVLPFPLAGKSRASMTVERYGRRTAARDLTIAAAAPGIFTLDASGRGPAAVINENGTINSAAAPAPRSSIVSVYLTGLGPLEGPVPDGSIAAEALRARAAVTARAGGQDAEVLYAGAAPGFVQGAGQVNIRIPASAPAGDRVSLEIVAAGVSSGVQATIAVR